MPDHPRRRPRRRRARAGSQPSDRPETRAAAGDGKTTPRPPRARTPTRLRVPKTPGDGAAGSLNARAPAASEGAPKFPERVSRSISRAAGQRTTMQGEILNEEAGIEKGENARMASFVGAIAIADLVKQVYIKSLTMRSSDYVGQRLALKAQHTLLNVRS